ncbi:MAG: NUDIX domain-containing protein [Lachnospiraceae bacterium]|nr:NUDIX domain-containing protein [Lachnospiraceae bacterium]
MQNSEGKLLMTQRHPDKKAGGLWEFTGGGVLAGETTTQAALRELEEELGVTAEEADLSLLAVYQHKNYFMDIYVAKKDVEASALVLQPDEVVDAKWLSHEEIVKMIQEKQVVWSVGLRYGMYAEKLGR